MTTMAVVPAKKSQQHGKQTSEEDVVEEVQPDVADSKEVVAKTDALLSEIDQILAKAQDEWDWKIAPLDDEKPYTLADAMREGEQVTDQAIGSWMQVKEAGQRGETCALSAAYLALKARGLAE